MQNRQDAVVDHLSETVEDLYHSFGAWKTVKALLRAMRRQRQARNRISHLSDAMLRDMGLPERKDRPFRGQTFLWDILK